MDKEKAAKTDNPVDVIVIGGGPGGYVAAIRATQLGGKVVLVEKDKLGGTCLNRGCIPTKTLLHSSAYLQAPHEAAKVGVGLKQTGLDLARMIQNKDQVTAQLSQGIRALVAANKIEWLSGQGRLINANTIEIQTASGVVRRTGRKLIIATGSRPAALPVPGSDSPGVINSDQALAMPKVPARIIVVGGGAVGIEFACIYRNLGAEVSVVEMLPQILPPFDIEVAAVLEKELLQQGIAIFKSAKVKRISQTDGGLIAEIETDKGTVRLEAEQLLAAAGRAPVTDGLHADAAGLELERGKFVVNNRMETNVKDIYAIGDVAAGGMLLAHTASAEAMVAAENAMGGDLVMDYRIVPGCIYSIPEVAGVGLTETAAREKGYQVKVGKFPFSHLGKAIAVGAPEGLVKIVADEKHGEILGVHIVGERATDVIAEAALAMRLEATVEELTATIHAHPTIAEALFEAAHAVHGKAIHLPPR